MVSLILIGLLLVLCSLVAVSLLLVVSPTHAIHSARDISRRLCIMLSVARRGAVGVRALCNATSRSLVVVAA